MPFITGGHVQYTRRIKTGDYEHKDIVVLLNWSAQEAETGVEVETFARKISNLAQIEAERLATGKVPDPVSAAEAPKRGRPPKVQAIEDIGPVAAPAAAVKDELDESPTLAAAAAKSTPAPSQVAPKQDDLGEDVTSALPPEITDKQVVDEITHTNGRIKNATVIRQLIGEYAGGPPKTSRDIPQNKRAEFVAKLKELKP